MDEVCHVARSIPEFGGVGKAKAEIAMPKFENGADTTCN
jgi:hypothetical protein